MELDTQYSLNTLYFLSPPFLKLRGKDKLLS